MCKIKRFVIQEKLALQQLPWHVLLGLTFLVEAVVMVWIWSVPKGHVLKLGCQPAVLLGGSVTLGGGAQRKEVSSMGMCFWRGCGDHGFFCSCSVHCTLHKVTPLSHYTLPAIMFFLTAGQNQVTMDSNLKNNEPKSTFPPCKLIVSGILSQWQKADHHNSISKINRTFKPWIIQSILLI
jgi:hypothetical protein